MNGLRPSKLHDLHARILAVVEERISRSRDGAKLREIGDLLRVADWSPPVVGDKRPGVQPKVVDVLYSLLGMMGSCADEIGLIGLADDLAPVLADAAWHADYPDHAVLGTRFAHMVVHSDRRLVVGCNIVAGNTDYPAHAHAAEEIYIPLTNSDAHYWQANHPEGHVGRAGDVIYHASQEPHALKTGALPVLNLWFQFGTAPGGLAHFV